MERELGGETVHFEEGNPLATPDRSGRSLIFMAAPVEIATRRYHVRDIPDRSPGSRAWVTR